MKLTSRYIPQSAPFIRLHASVRLFERDFIAQTDEILEALLPFKVQKALLSATLPSSVEEMAATVMGSSLLRVIVGQKSVQTTTCDQSIHLLPFQRFGHRLDRTRAFVCRQRRWKDIITPISDLLWGLHAAGHHLCPSRSARKGIIQSDCSPRPSG